MPDETPGPEWIRLGTELMARRIELGFPKRKPFAVAKGFKNDRVLAALENHERTNFSKGTLTSIEIAYEWEIGSIDSILAGGDPAPKHGRQEMGGASFNDPAAGEWMSGQTIRDENGAKVVIGESGFTDERGVTSRLEIRFWPGDERQMRHPEFMSVIGDAHRASLEALRAGDAEFNDVTRPRHLQAARNTGRQSDYDRRTTAQDEAGEENQDPGGLE